MKSSTTPQADLPTVLMPPISASVALLLDSRIPARLAWVAGDGTPRIVPIWFGWNGAELLMATFAGAKKLDDLSDGTAVAVSIDSDAFPYRSLKLRGPLTVRPTVGLAPEYRDAAARYLGPAMGERWLEFVGDRDQVVLSLRPSWAVAVDMNVDSPILEQV